MLEFYNVKVSDLRETVIACRNAMRTKMPEYTGEEFKASLPRAIALAEAGWSQQQNRSWESFIKRMSPLAKDMMRRGVTFSMEY